MSRKIYILAKETVPDILSGSTALTNPGQQYDAYENIEDAKSAANQRMPEGNILSIGIGEDGEEKIFGLGESEQPVLEPNVTAIYEVTVEDALFDKLSAARQENNASIGKVYLPPPKVSAIYYTIGPDVLHEELGIPLDTMDKNGQFSLKEVQDELKQRKEHLQLLSDVIVRTDEDTRKLWDFNDESTHELLSEIFGNDADIYYNWDDLDPSYHFDEILQGEFEQLCTQALIAHGDLNIVQELSAIQRLVENKREFSESSLHVTLPTTLQNTIDVIENHIKRTRLTNSLDTGLSDVLPQVDTFLKTKGCDTRTEEELTAIAKEVARGLKEILQKEPIEGVELRLDEDEMPDAFQFALTRACTHDYIDNKDSMLNSLTNKTTRALKTTLKTFCEVVPHPIPTYGLKDNENFEAQLKDILSKAEEQCRGVIMKNMQNFIERLHGAEHIPAAGEIKLFPSLRGTIQVYLNNCEKLEVEKIKHAVKFINRDFFAEQLIKSFAATYGNTEGQEPDKYKATQISLLKSLNITLDNAIENGANPTQINILRQGISDAAVKFSLDQEQAKRAPTYSAFQDNLFHFAKEYLQTGEIPNVSIQKSVPPFMTAIGYIINDSLAISASTIVRQQFEQSLFNEEQVRKQCTAEFETDIRGVAQNVAKEMFQAIQQHASKDFLRDSKITERDILFHMYHRNQNNAFGNIQSMVEIALQDISIRGTKWNHEQQIKEEKRQEPGKQKIEELKTRIPELVKEAERRTGLQPPTTFITPEKRIEEFKNRNGEDAPPQPRTDFSQEQEDVGSGNEEPGDD